MDNKRKHIIGFKLTDTELQSLNALLRRRFITKSELMRDLLTKELLKEGLINDISPVID